MYDQLQSIEDRYEELGELLVTQQSLAIQNVSWNYRKKKLIHVRRLRFIADINKLLKGLAMPKNFK